MPMPTAKDGHRFRCLQEGRTEGHMLLSLLALRGGSACEASPSLWCLMPCRSNIAAYHSRPCKARSPKDFFALQANIVQIACTLLTTSFTSVLRIATKRKHILYTGRDASSVGERVGEGELGSSWHHCTSAVGTVFAATGSQLRGHQPCTRVGRVRLHGSWPLQGLR